VTQEISLYDAAGGMPFFEALVDRFYDGVAADPELLAIYPEPDDLSGARPG
jgi:hemoglobin